MPPENKRLEIVDALRGFAIVSIMLLHNIEHFDLYFRPTWIPLWLQGVDQSIWNSLFFLFGGKSYAIFALLFGLTFSIQAENQQAKGKDFRGRFIWRLCLLFGFGLFNACFYQGDILMIYAALGLSLVLVQPLGNRAILTLAIVLLLQPYLLYLAYQGWQHPLSKVANPVSWSYFGIANEYLTKESFLNTCLGNRTNGRTAVVLWTWETGRAVQSCALFMFGLLAGRVALFASLNDRVRWIRILLVSAAAFILLFCIEHALPNLITNKSLSSPLGTAVGSWSNMAFMVLLISSFVLLFQWSRARALLGLLAPIGRMSLSNYIFQSLLGTTIYYGFGLGLYQYTGSSLCLLIGLALALGQGFFSHRWMRSHKQGPLETLWHKATWINLKKQTQGSAS